MSKLNININKAVTESINIVEVMMIGELEAVIFLISIHLLNTFIGHKQCCFIRTSQLHIR